MRLLIVEDDEPKWTALVNFIGNHFPSFEVAVEKSLQSGVRHIRTQRADLILLDMTLPNFDSSADEDGGVTHGFGGREFLRQLDRFDITTPVIVITQFETFSTQDQTLRLPELDEQLRAEHGTNYLGAIYYHAAIHDWEEKLFTLVQQVAVSTQTRSS